MNPQNEPPPVTAILCYLVLLLVTAGLQSAVAAHISILGGEPDFVLTLAAVAALLSNGRAGVLTGFSAGLVTASLVGQTVGTLLVSRTLAGWLAGWSTARLYRDNAVVVILGVLLASVLADIVYLLAAPHLFSHGLKASLLGALWNAVLAYPTMLILRRCGWGIPVAS